MTALGEIGRVGDGQVDIFVCAYRVVNGGLTFARVRDPHH